MSSSAPDARLAAALAAVRGRSAAEPRLALTLGSGLGGVIDRLADATRIPTAEIPHWPRSTVAGHPGTLALGSLAGTAVVALAGRSHRYEGYSLEDVTFAVRVMRALGARTMIFTNAVGAIDARLSPGDLVLASDHINFIGRRGLLSPAEQAAKGGARRVASPYSAALRDALRSAALAAGIPLREGVLLGTLGPSYETAAEIRMAAALGADVVCMSTVHEVTLAAELGCEAASISCVANRATGLAAAPLSHADVTAVADRGAATLSALLETFCAARAKDAR